MCTSRYNGVGGVVSNCHAVVAVEVVGTCVIVGCGFKGRYLDYVQSPQPNKEAQTMPCLSFIFCFVML